MSRRLLALLGAGSFCLSGCGTFSDSICGPATDHVFYRGVRLDVLAIKEGGWKTLMVADIPFSAILDTLMIPYLGYQLHTDPRPEHPEPTANEGSNPDFVRPTPSGR